MAASTLEAGAGASLEDASSLTVSQISIFASAPLLVSYVMSRAEKKMLICEMYSFLSRLRLCASFL